jgi:hypothetical protein
MNTTADVLSRYPYIQESNEPADEANEVWINIDEDGQIQDEWEIEDISMNTFDSFRYENSTDTSNTHDEEILSTSVVSMDTSILDSVYTTYKDDKLFGPVIAYPKRYPAYTLYDDLIFYQDRLYIPTNDRTT